MCSLQGIPVRETLQALYKINRDKTLKEFCLFLVWSLLFVSIVFAVNDVHTTFATNDALLDLFLDEEFAEYVEVLRSLGRSVLTCVFSSPCPRAQCQLQEKLPRDLHHGRVLDVPTRPRV